MLSTERQRQDVHVLFGDISYDVRKVHWRVNNKIKRKFTLMLRTHENTDAFITLDDNIYGSHSKRENILYISILNAYSSV